MTREEMQEISINATVTRTIHAFEKNNISAYFVKTKEEAKNLALSMINQGDSVATGGSMSLVHSGIMDELRSGKYNFLNINAKDKTPEEIRKNKGDIAMADAFFCSANAITEEGVLYNVDGNANRTSSIAFGPAKVIVVASINKIVRNLSEAVYRVKTVAAPANGVRLKLSTPCAINGCCVKKDGQMFEGCSNPDRMCCQYLITGFQRNKDRIRVILCQEEMGL